MVGRYKPYPEYKNSGVTWMGAVPRHWQQIRFKHALLEKRKTSNPTLEAGSISFGNVVYKNSDNLSPETKASYQEVLAGEFLINPLNLNFDLISLRTALSAIDVVVSTGYIILIGHGRFVKHYLRWLLQEFDVAHMKTLGAGVRQTINYSDVANSYFFEPEVAEQEKIANFLDHETAKIDTLIEKQQQLTQLLKEKRQTVFSLAVTKGLNPNAKMRDSGIEWLGEVPEHWDVCRLKQASSFITSGPRGWSDHISENGEEIFLQSGDLDNKLGLDLNGAKRVIPPKNAEGIRTKLEAGDVVVCITGGNTGRVAIAQELSGTVYINQHLSLVRAIKSRVIPQYLGIFLSSSSAKTYFAVNQYGLKEGLSLTDISEAPLCIPPLSEQIAIIELINSTSASLDQLEAKTAEQVALLQERRTALISAAVTGKIDLRNWASPQVSQTNKEVAA